MSTSSTHGPSFWQGGAALAAFWLVLAGCQPEDPYQSADAPPVAAETHEATAPLDHGGAHVPGATAQLPIAERAAGAAQAWNDATEADYQAAIADCQTLGGQPRLDCIEQVELGFRAAISGAQNPAEIEDSTVDMDPAATASTDDDQPL